MTEPEPTDERPPDVKRGAFPTPRSDIDSAPRFEPEPDDADRPVPDDDSTTRDTDRDATASEPAGGSDPPPT